METKIVTFDNKALRYSVDGKPLVCAILAQMERNDHDVLVGDPGLVAIAQRVGYDSPSMRAAVQTIGETANRALAQRLEAANAYLDRTCVAFDGDVAKATGCLLIAAKAAAKPTALTAAQAPWRAEGTTGLLIEPGTIAAFYQAAAQVKGRIEVGPGRYEEATCAEWLRRIQVQQFGTAEAQAHNAAAASAEEAQGEFDGDSVNAVFGTLIEESADPTRLSATTRRSFARIGARDGASAAARA